MIRINKTIRIIRTSLDIDELHNIQDMLYRIKPFASQIEMTATVQIRQAYRNAFIFEVLFLEEAAIRRFFRTVYESTMSREEARQMADALTIKTTAGQPAKLSTDAMKILEKTADMRSWEHIKNTMPSEIVQRAFVRYGRRIMDIKRADVPDERKTQLIEWRTGRNGESGLSFDIQRDIRTESARAVNVAALDVYKDAGVQFYRFCSILDDRLCAGCHELNGKIFRVAEAQEGLNFPPIHPHCRCYIEWI